MGTWRTDPLTPVREFHEVKGFFDVWGIWRLTSTYSLYVTFVKLKKRVMPPATEWADNIYLHNNAFHNNAILHGISLLLFIMIIMPRTDQSWPLDSLFSTFFNVPLQITSPVDSVSTMFGRSVCS
jgi:hypothetical protein